MIRLLILLLLCAMPAFAQAPAPAAPPSAEIERALDILRDDARRNALIRDLEALSGAQRAAQPEQAAAEEAIAQATEEVGRFIDRMVEGLRSAADLPAIMAWISDAATDENVRSRVLELVWKLLVVFGAGLVLERILRRVVHRWCDRLDAVTPPEGTRHAWFTRLPYISARLMLDLVPVGGFAALAWFVIQALPGWPSQRVILWTVALAYIAARGIIVVGRLLFSPASNHLRILPVADETAGYATIWIRRITLVTVGAYAASEFALLLAMPPALQIGVWRLGLLVVSAFVAIIVLQNKLVVAQWLAAPALADDETPDRSRRFLRGLRDRLADAWHVLTIMWVVALWGVWALELERGFERLLNASALTVLAIVLAKLADEGMRRGLERAFSIGPDLAKRLPGLEARANRYLPAIKGLLSAGIMLTAAIVLLEIWGLGAFAWFSHGRLGARLLSSIISIGLTLMMALLVWEAANTAIQRHLAKLSADAATARSARVRTLLPMLRTVIAGVVLVVAGITILTEIGVNVAPLLAGAGVIGLAVGFGSQTLVRDIITGIFLLFEDAVAVGDVVTVGGLSGTVEALSIRSIRLRALDGSIHIVPFSAVSTVTNQTRDYGFAVLDLAVDYDTDTDRVEAVLKEVGQALRLDDVFGAHVLAPIEVMGVDKLTDSGVVVRGRIKTVPLRRWAVAREFNRRVKQRCDELGIVIVSKPKQVVVNTSP